MADRIKELEARISAYERKIEESLAGSGIPGYMHSGIVLYVVRGLRSGDFLTAILANDLHGAVQRADMNNRHRLVDYVHWFYNEAPADCWGSSDKVAAWIAGGGAAGAFAAAAEEGGS